jgi:hypothetical protein
MKRVQAAFTLGLFRIVLVDDETYNFNDLCGDMFNPEAHPDIDPTVLARQKRAYRARVTREGVYGAVMQVRNTPTGEWVDIESIWGNVGEDFIGSGYDIDFLSCADDWLSTKLDLPTMQTALDALVSTAK